jgi:short-subunit dehydrogenase
MDIKDKVIIVTGTSQGIGLALARALYPLGPKLVLAARSAETIKTLEKELPGSLAITTDMRDPEAIKQLVKKTVEHFGRIDLLINNAGQAYYGPVENIEIDKYQSIIDLNVYGPLRAMQAVIPQMRSQGGGMILNISSMVSKSYFPNLGAYASTKYALNAISLTARLELEKDKIVVSVFHPRMTATNFGKNSIGVRLFENRSASAAGAMQIDSAEAVAKKVIEQIRSEAAESMMS